MDGRVLLVEESFDLMDVIAVLLRQEGCEVRATSRGTDAIMYAAKEAFDLAIVDLEVREIGGLGVAHVVQDLAGVPVIVTSADPATWESRSLRLGAAAWLPKPFGLDDLFSLVRTMMAARVEDPLPGRVEDLSREDLEQIRSMSDAELDALPFGLIKVGPGDVITSFNAYEAEASGYLAATVIGRRLSDVAPCMKVKAFLEGIQEVKEDPSRSRVLRFVFPRRRATSLVTVRLYYEEVEDQLWVFISSRSGGD